MRFSANQQPSLSDKQRLWFATIVTLAAIFIFLVSCTSCVSRYEPKMPTTRDYGVARLIIAVDGVDSSYCTVWKIDSGMAVTAGHCCPSPAEILAERAANKELEKLIRQLTGEAEPEEEDKPVKMPVVTFKADGAMSVKGAAFKVLRDDDLNDVCVLQGQIQGLPISIASHEPAKGEKVWTEGYPKGVFLITDGYWSGAMNQETVVASTGIWGGASGSPVMNQDGEAVAVLVRYMPPMSNLTLMSPLEWLQANITSARRVLE